MTANTTGRHEVPQTCPPALTASQIADLLGLDPRSARRTVADLERFPNASKDAAGTWLVPLSDLPQPAQAAFLARGDKASPNPWPADERRELADAEDESIWRQFEDASATLKEKAARDADACRLWLSLRREGKSAGIAAAEVASQYAIGKTALYEKIERISGYDPMHWPALLLGRWNGSNARRVDWPAGAWDFFLSHARCPDRPIKAAWRSTVREAKAQGWGGIPSYSKALSDWNALPADVRVYMKEGETALKALGPKLSRDYDIPVNDTWSADGRTLDVMVFDETGKLNNGKPFRPIVYLYEDVRSRYVLGYEFGESLTSDLVRDAFNAAIKTTDRHIPFHLAPDNGREIGAKENSGGAPWRRRGKVLEDEIIGLFPAIGVEIVWTMVAHGQAKPVERSFRTIAQNTETRPELRGAYCGRSPDTRPEEWDKAKAAPLSLLRRLYAEEVEAYNRSPHRGDGMNGRSPYQAYCDGLREPGAVVRRLTEAQARLCTYSAAQITLRKDGSFALLGVSYRSDATAALPKGAGYFVRYDPLDLAAPVHVYRGEKKLCEAVRIERASFNDKDAGKRITKARATYIRSVKNSAAALENLAAQAPAIAAALAAKSGAETVDTKTGEILPAAAVVGMVRTRGDLPEAGNDPATIERAELAAKVREMQMKQGGEAADRLRKQAALGR